ncbi:hypothetical protein L1887_40127 [Cichorium endivia]|nr:hypothetical protein L1887_40127 [Cichorium endivia]
MRLLHYLSKISHRFRSFLLLQFLVITASQFSAVLQTTENQGIINFINTGDFAILSIIELVGIVLCLSAASKVSHRAQGLGSVACRWHALVTCDSNDSFQSQYELPIDSKNLDVACTSQSELESGDFVPLSVHNQFACSFVLFNRFLCLSDSYAHKAANMNLIFILAYGFLFYAI